MEKTNSGVAMKRFIIISGIISIFTVLNSCEKHEWKDTKKLHVDKAEKKDSHHVHDQAENSDDHGH